MSDGLSLFDVPVVDITVEQVRAIDLDAVIASVQPALVDDFFLPLRAKRESLEAASDDVAAALVRLMEVVVGFGVQEDNQRQPFGPKGTLTSGLRTPIVEDLEEGHFVMLERARDAVEDPELKSRVADVLWQRKRRNIADARLAVETYMASAARLDASNMWIHPYRRVKRAFEIAASIIKGAPESFGLVEPWLLVRVRSLDGSDDLYYSERLMRLLTRTVRTDEEKREFAEQAMRTAQRARAQGDPMRSRAYYEMAAKWFGLLKAENDARLARISAAETLIDNARAQGQKIAKAGILAEAVQALRNAGAPSERIDIVKRELDAAQRESLSEMGVVSAPFDVSEMANTARRVAKGLAFSAALRRLTHLFSIPSVAALREEVERLVQLYPLRMMISSRRVDTSGRVTGTRDGFLSDPDRREAAVAAEMREAAERRRLMAVLGVIEPFREEMLLEHAPSPYDFFELVRDRPFVPDGRAEFFARGLHAGYYGDFLEATHLLLPQLENSLRALLAMTGTIIYSQDEAGRQDVFDLNRVLDEPNLKQALGDDIVFDLSALLVSRFGANLRNVVSHGLVDPPGTRGPAAIYLWWVTLHLILGLNFTDPPRTIS